MIDTDQLIIDHLLLVKKLATRAYMKSNMDNYDELYSDGCYGLIKAAGRYDPSYNTSFATYAYRRIVGEITDGLRKSNIVHSRHNNRDIGVVYNYPLETLPDSHNFVDSVIYNLDRISIIKHLFNLNIDYNLKLRFYLHYFCAVSSKDLAMLFDRTSMGIISSNQRVLIKLVSAVWRKLMLIEKKIEDGKWRDVINPVELDDFFTAVLKIKPNEEYADILKRLKSGEEFEIAGGIYRVK